MIKPNKNKLIPCADVAWGDIKGSISMQSDLISLLSDYATESWVSEQGFMTSESLSGYATESWVEGQEYITSESLAGYATESWVSEQGFLSEVPSDYATKNWVNNKNFATKSWVSSNFLSEVPSQYATQSWVINKNYASKSWVSSNFLSEVPSEYATKSWVESNGYLSEIPSEYATKEWVSNKDYASKVWVYEQKYLKKVPSEYATQSWVSETLSSYATESWVISTLSSYTPDLSSYATKSWVEDKGYITSSALSGYATESYVQEQGFLTSQSLKTINNESIVGSGNIEVGGLTPEQEDAVEILTNSSKGTLYTEQIDSYSLVKKQESHIGEPWGLYQVDDDVYYFNNLELLKFNKDTASFDYITRLNSSTNQSLWKDATGRLYDGLYMIDLVNSTEVYIDMGYPSFYYNEGRTNILYGEYGIWCVDQYNLQKFDESTQKFIGGYTVNVPEGYQDSLSSCMASSFKYDGHILYDNGTSTYEIVEYEDHIDVVDVTDSYYIRPSFSIYSYRIFGTDSGLFYMQEYNHFKYYPENNEWDRISISADNTYCGYRYAVTGDFLVGGFYFTGGEYCVTNLGDDNWKKTSWIDVKDIAVDLSSDQTVNGYKNFKGGLQAGSLQIENSFYGNGWIRLGQNNSKIEAQKDLNLSVPGLCTLNDKTIAVTDQCILNRSYSYPGPRFEVVAGFVNMNSNYTYYFVTPSGRLIYSDPNNQVAYEFNGTQWVQLQSVTTFVIGEWRAELNDGLYVINTIDYSLYKWDDTNSDWVFIINNMPEQNIWAADANTLRCGSLYKLVNNGGTYEWDSSDPTISYGYQKSLKVGQTYYYVNTSGVYTYDESAAAKDFTFIGNTQYADGNVWFTFNGCLYYFYSSSIRKVDPSQVGTDQWDVQTDIFYSTWDTAYVVYDNKIWTVKYNDSLGYNQLGYTYDLTESFPEVPNTNGTYVLKAVRTNAGVTYSWVTDEVPQAIQITNQILS